jgi:hypothetical protein
LGGSTEVLGLTKLLPVALGAGGPRFKSGRPDQNVLRIFFDLLKAPFTQNSSVVEFDQTGGSEFASRLIPKISPHDKYSKTGRGRSAMQKTLTGGKLNARHLACTGKIQGTLCISGLINLRKCKSVIAR